jgi:hypothetical protein
LISLEISGIISEDACRFFRSLSSKASQRKMLQVVAAHVVNSQLKPRKTLQATNPQSLPGLKTLGHVGTIFCQDHGQNPGGWRVQPVAIGC